LERVVLGRACVSEAQPQLLMGAGASAPRRASEQWSPEECAAMMRKLELANVEIPEAVLRRRMSGGQLMAMSEAQLHELLGAAGEDARAILGELNKHRSLSSEEKSLEDGMERRRSEIADETQEEIRAAPDADRARLLAAAMVREADRGRDGESEFAAWALSCVAELSQGHSANRTAFVEHNVCELSLRFMGLFGDDIYVQWQGCQAIGCLAATAGAAERFGQGGMVSVMRCLCRTDVGELGYAGIRAFSSLVHGSAANMALAVEHGAARVIEELLDSWPAFLQFQFSGRKLIDQIEAAAERAGADAGDGGETKE